MIWAILIASHAFAFFLGGVIFFVVTSEPDDDVAKLLHQDAVKASRSRHPSMLRDRYDPGLHRW